MTKANDGHIQPGCTVHRWDIREPEIHSHITDVLPESHRLAHQDVLCDHCGQLLHSYINECMQTWVEAGSGNFCLSCFVHVTGGGAVLDGDMGLPE